MADLAFLYAGLIDGTDEDVERIEEAFCTYLDNGWDWQSIHRDIVQSNMTTDPFPYYKYAKPYTGGNPNLVKQDKFYYHKKLKLISRPPSVNYDIDTGTMERKDYEYWCEEVASLTLSELMDFVYEKLGEAIDHREYPRKRISGLLKFYLGEFNIDEMLFMIEAAARLAMDGKRFDFAHFRDYYPPAKQYIEEISNNCKYTGGGHYVRRSRKLFS